MKNVLHYLEFILLFSCKNEKLAAKYSLSDTEKSELACTSPYDSRHIHADLYRPQEI